MNNEERKRLDEELEYVSRERRRLYEEERISREALIERIATFADKCRADGLVVTGELIREAFATPHPKAP